MARNGENWKENSQKFHVTAAGGNVRVSRIGRNNTRVIQLYQLMVIITKNKLR